MPVDPSQVMVVPVNVVAFCVGKADAGDADPSQGTGSFAGATTVYENIATNDTLAYLGANATKSFDDSPWQQMEQGVHLHWALPDAMTKATLPKDGKGPLNFPAVPNHWLVSRLIIKDKTPSIRSWVVESDALSETMPDDQKRVTVRVIANAGEQNYRYLGKHSAIEDYAPPLNGDRPFKNMTNLELTAVATGTASFAPFYPDCRSAFGFYDDLTDVTEPANLMYVVTGWFDHPDNDPAQSGLTLDALRKTHRWAAAQANDDPARTLYSGFVQDISWSEGTPYVYEQASQDPIKAEVAIGSNPAEVMAAFFGAKVQPEDATFESLLNALQFGLLDKFVEPHGDRMAKLRELLHEKEFAASNAGSIYVVVKQPPDASLKDDPQADALDLPLKLADDLNALNILQQQYDLSQAHLAEYRWQLFADWYRLSKADPNTFNTALRVTEHRVKDWKALTQAGETLKTQLSGQLDAVQNQIGADLVLKSVPAERYWQPTEPSVLISSQELAFPSRYGGDAASGPDGHLACRMADQLIASVTAGGQPLAADFFAPVIQNVASSKVPDADICGALLGEACLLNTTLLGNITGQDAAGLQTAIKALLSREKPAQLQVVGQAPSAVAAHWWDGNPWLPIFLSWSAQMAPLHETMPQGNLEDYPSDLFTANFTVDPAQGGFVGYAPQGNAPFNPSYDNDSSGWAILSPAPARHFASQLSDFLARHPCDWLTKVSDQLAASNVLVQSLNGFTLAQVMREQSLQVPVDVGPPPAKPSPKLSAFAQVTGAVKPIVAGTNGAGAANNTSPIMFGSFNPIRAGFLSLNPQPAGSAVNSTQTQAMRLVAIDAFGQKRTIEFTNAKCAASMTAMIGNMPIPSAAYLAPRLSQPARLLFRWIAADSAALDEMNSHPATSPVCGWLLPDHMQVGFFLYDQQGKPLGHLSLNGDKSEVEWQSAPGDERTINQPIDQVLAHTHPQMLALGVALMEQGADFFEKFWEAVDGIHGTINPANLALNSGLGILIGRPVALLQASLRLEVKGRPALNQSFNCFQPNTHIDTDHAFSGVNFPVVLGDLNQWDDGLIGFFKQSNSGFKLDTFYTGGAEETGETGVVQPVQTTLILTVTPKRDAAEPPALAPDTAKVLMLVDPRARVHASMGILPTQTLEIPPDVTTDALSQLEMSFLAAPVLKGQGGLAIPVPSEPGYEVSWVEEVGASSAPQWSVQPQIASPSSGGVWTYTPQILSEGWLRFNPAVLEFSLLDENGRSLATRGPVKPLTLKVVNRKPGRAIGFKPGDLVNEGDDAAGSIFYIHFGKLVAQADVPKMTLTATDWTFGSFSDTRYGQYWAATPAKSVELAVGDSIAITVSNLLPATDPALVQANIYFDYYDLEGVSDGVYAELMAIAGEAPK
jgi:hypothetical protein